MTSVVAKFEKPAENNGPSVEQYPNLRPFKKGQSGNPGGRPAGSQEVRELARTYTAEAIECLAQWMRQNKHPSASVAAANAILDRGWGKPVQEINASNTNINLTLSATIEQAARLIGHRADEFGGADRLLEAGPSAVRSNGAEGEEDRALANGGAKGDHD